jgi:DHA3 family macrolide efflux protein-like MFS transporter
MPSVGALIPDIVPKEHLTRVNGFQSSINSSTAFLSPIIAGALMTFFYDKFYTIFIIDVITATIGISIVYFFVKLPKKEIANSDSIEIKKDKTSYFQDLIEGYHYIKDVA